MLVMRKRSVKGDQCFLKFFLYFHCVVLVFVHESYKAQSLRQRELLAATGNVTPEVPEMPRQ